MNSDLGQHLKIEIANGSLLFQINVMPTLPANSRAASDQDRQIIMIVPIPVTDSRPIQAHDIIQQAVATLVNLGHPLKHSRKEFNVQRIDLGEFVQFLLFLLVVRRRMMRSRRIDLRVASPRFFIGKHEACYAGRIGLKRERKNIEHQVDMFGIVRWNPLAIGNDEFRNLRFVGMQ